MTRIGAGIKTRILRIGNSLGIQLPRPLLDEAGFGPDSEVVVEAAPGLLTIRADQPRRLGWDEAFAAMASQGDDAASLPETATRFDETEWEW